MPALKYKLDQFEIDFIATFYTDLSASQIARLFGVPKFVVKNIVNRIGLRKGRNGGCFFSGHKPWNKGMKGLPSIGRMSGTQFKIGHVPFNQKPIGTVIIREDKRTGRVYQYIKIDPKNWMGYHKYLWTQKNGPIPSGMRVVFKDGNQLNCVIENLEIISPQEAMVRTRNSDMFIAKTIASTGRGNFDRVLAQELLKNPELIQLKRLQLNLQQQIHNTDESQH
jgi:hypothetical protein